MPNKPRILIHMAVVATVLMLLGSHGTDLVQAQSGREKFSFRESPFGNLLGKKEDTDKEHGRKNAENNRNKNKDKEPRDEYTDPVEPPHEEEDGAANPGEDSGEGDADPGEGENHDDINHEQDPPHEHIPADPTLPVPVCVEHDYTKWHGLVEYNSDESIKCTYTHEHKEDPNMLNHIFGPVGTYTGGQEISFPWQTGSHDHGFENYNAHNVYDWNVVSVETCRPSNAPYGFKNLRGQFHADGAMGAATRFHSYWLEAQVCDPEDPSYSGIIRTGGHMDYGRLDLTGYGKVDLPGSPTVGDDVRLHMGYIDGEVPCCRNGDFTWYGSNRYIREQGKTKVSVRNGIRKQDWGALSPDNPSQIVFNPRMWFGSTFNGNGSWHEPMHLLHINVPAALDANDGVVDGRVNFTGYTNRFGDIHTEPCGTVGPDCVPIVLENMKVGNYQFRADVNGIKVIDYDVKVNGESLIRFPN